MATDHTKLVYDPITNSWQAPQPPATPALQRRAGRERAARAVHAAQSSAHKDLARSIAQHLDAMESAVTGGVEPFVRGNTNPRATFDQRQNAAAAINSNLQMAQTAAQGARDALSQLRQQTLAAIVPTAQQVNASDIAIESRKQDIVSDLEQTGKRDAQAEAEELVHEAVAQGDRLTLYVLLGDPLRIRAGWLGIDQTALQALYGRLQLAAEGPYPLGGSALPSDELVAILDSGDLEAAIKQHSDDAQGFLMQLGRDTGLIPQR